MLKFTLLPPITCHYRLWIHNSSWITYSKQYTALIICCVYNLEVGYMHSGPPTGRDKWVSRPGQQERGGGGELGPHDIVCTKSGPFKMILSRVGQGCQLPFMRYLALHWNAVWFVKTQCGTTMWAAYFCLKPVKNLCLNFSQYFWQTNNSIPTENYGTAVSCLSSSSSHPCFLQLVCACIILPLGITAVG